MKLKTGIRVLCAVFLVMTGQFAGAEPADQFDLSQYEGKVVVLDFWASWCVPCRRSFPWLNEMHARYEDAGLVIVGINLNEKREDADAFLKEYPADFQVYFDPTAALAAEYGVEAMPSSYVIGRDGAIKARHLGFKLKRTTEYEAILKEALGVQP